MKYICKICGYIYDDEKQGVAFESLPDDWKCPLCGASKDMFKKVEEDVKNTKIENSESIGESLENHELKKLSNKMLSTIFSNLARGCEKQYKFEEMELFKQISNYYDKPMNDLKNVSVDNIINLCNDDLHEKFPMAEKFLIQAKDRGGLRAKTWSEKVTFGLVNLLERYKKEGDKMLDDLNVWVCTICGFIFVGKELPLRCPVCKVPNFKFEKIEGERT